MNFFEELKEELASKVEDLGTVEHAFLSDHEDVLKVLIYRKQELDGDSITFQVAHELDSEVLQTFNKAFEAAIISRTGILSALIKIFN